jgi:Tfp pilus assembly protein PilO
MIIKNFANLNLKQKILASLLFFIGFVVAIVFFAIIPAVKDIKKIKYDIQAERMDLEEKYLKGQSLRNLSEKLKKVEEKTDQLNNVFIDKKENFQFITNLENLAERNKVSQKINLSKFANETDVYETVPVKISAQGAVGNILSYIRDLENLDYYMNIFNLELTALGNSTAGPGEQFVKNANLLISADTYWVQNKYD